MKSTVDLIEEYGAAVSAGLMARSEAANALSWATDGGLTRLGAADMIDKWQSARGRYKAIFAEASEALQRMINEAEGTDA